MVGDGCSEEIIFVVSRIHVIQEVEVKSKQINLYLILPREVLQNRSQETLRKEETANPENGRWRVQLRPLAERLTSQVEVLDVACQWFETRVRHFQPRGWHLTPSDGVHGYLQLRCHKSFAILDQQNSPQII